MNLTGNTATFWAILWQTSALIVIALAAVFLLRRQSAQLRYAVLMLPLIKLILPPIPVTVSLEPQAYAPLFSHVYAAPARAGLQSALRPSPRQFWNTKVILLVVYAVGVLAGGVVLMQRHCRLRRIISRGKEVNDELIARIYGEVLATLGFRREAEVMRCAEIPGPMTAGLFKKRILLPLGVDFTSREMRIILAHESAHVNRRDVLVNAAQSIIQVLWWFNPLVWVLNRAIRRTREECCDEVLLARDAVEAEEYCQALISAARKLVRMRLVLPAVGIGGHPIAQRIARILNPGVQVTGRLRKGQIAWIAALACFALPNISVTAERPILRSIEELLAFPEFTEPEIVMNGQMLDGVDWAGRRLRNAALCNVSLKNANLKGVDLRGANLTGANLAGADLSRADLTKANLTGADLSNAILTGASLTWALLSGAQLDGAILDDANLDWAFLRGTIITSTTVISAKWRMVVELMAGASDLRDLRNADLARANLSRLVLANGQLDGADLTGADLRFSDLRGTVFEASKMNTVNLEGSQLEGANLRGAMLERVNLSRSKLAGANLSSADLSSAVLARADLSKANLSSANLAKADLRWTNLRGIRVTAATQLEAKWRLAKDLQENGAAGHDLAGADLSELDLRNISFKEADLSGSNFRNAVISGSDFSRARLTGANLNGTQLGIKTEGVIGLAPKWALANDVVSRGAANRDLSGADLSDANLSGAHLEGAVFHNANLNGAILDGTNLRSARLEKASLDRVLFHNTVMPDGSIRSDGC